MARLIAYAFFLSLGLAVATAATNYCATSLCGGLRHIACKNNGAWSSICPTSPKPKLVTITKALRQQILKIHNTKRNLIASGKMKGYKAATRMATMRWNAELAKIASYNVKQCRMMHDKCRNTPTFRTSGQNLASISTTGTLAPTLQLVSTSINNWWAEYKDASMTIINKYPNSHSGPDIGHFTAMAQMKNTFCGCAMATYTTNGRKTFLLACNYATTNLIGDPVYVAGKAASGCKKGKNPTYPALCKAAEVYNL